MHGIDSNYPNYPFATPRSSKDKCSNTFGHSLIDLCCTYSMHMLNGRFPVYASGEFTCVAHYNKSSVDYIIVSTDLIDIIRNFSVGEKDVSEHPLQYTITCTREKVLFEQRYKAYGARKLTSIPSIQMERRQTPRFY